MRKSSASCGAAISKANGFRLNFEITESALMPNHGAISTLLSRLKDLNIGLDIDDFGTGYSSLSQLQHLPVQTLKIDRSFIARIGQDDDSLEIIRTIVALAHNLGMDVVAEGVETVHQLVQLKALNCEYAQGYYFGRPTDSDTAWSLVSRPGCELTKSVGEFYTSHRYGRIGAARKRLAQLIRSRVLPRGAAIL